MFRTNLCFELTSVHATSEGNYYRVRYAISSTLLGTENDIHPQYDQLREPGISSIDPVSTEPPRKTDFATTI
jgi:hypothetical protein